MPQHAAATFSVLAMLPRTLYSVGSMQLKVMHSAPLSALGLSWGLKSQSVKGHVAVEQYKLTLQVQRSSAAGALMLSDRRGRFTFGNTGQAFVIARQAIRAAMWRTETEFRPD